jgi:hypothetical protein
VDLADGLASAGRGAALFAAGWWWLYQKPHGWFRENDLLYPVRLPLPWLARGGLFGAAN